MDMQDKEFDELFRAELEDFELEPTEKVWPGIADGLDAVKRARNLAAWLGIAASVLVLVSLSVLLVTRQSHTVPQMANTITGIKSHKAVIKTVPAPVQSGPASTPASTQLAIVKPAHVQRLNRINNVGQNIKAIDSATAAPVRKDGPQWIAEVPQKQPVVTNAVVPDQALQLSVRSSISQLPGAQKMANILANNTADTVKQKHRIHSFGDLVNLVVAKIDKRKDKVIEFTDDGDGDSNITGVNLGIVKIKKGE